MAFKTGLTVQLCLVDAVSLIITKTCLHNFDSLKPHFYVVKLGFTGVYIIFLIFSEKKNIDCGYSLEPPRRGGSNEYPQSMFWAEIWKNVRIFTWKFSFLVVKFSVYLNRRVFVMWGSWLLLFSLECVFCIYLFVLLLYVIYRLCSVIEALRRHLNTIFLKWLHTPINFSIGYNAKKSKVSHLLQFHEPKSDPGFGGMWQPLESATDPGIFMSSSPLRKHMTLPAIWQPKNSSCSGSQTGMTDRLVAALHPAK